MYNSSTVLFRWRRLPISLSLAAKCQLLFGLAVVLIVSAALFVPWLRMEKLMGQLNERAARAVADRAVMDHVLSEKARQESSADDDPETRPSATTLPFALETQGLLPSRLLSPEALREKRTLTRFDEAALRDLLEDPDQGYLAREYTRKDGSRAYRYARPLFARQECLACHDSSTTAITHPSLLPRTSASATQPTNAPSRVLGIVSVDIESQVEENQKLLNRLFMFTAGLLAGTLAIIVFYLITTRLILRPVRVLQETAEKVSDGDLNIRSDINTGDEFQQLSETFNTMLEHLKESQDQLRAINKGLDLKLGQLAESNVALYESNRLKSEFLANVSHELRTPLNSILGFADILKDTLSAGADGKPTRYVQNILNSGRHLLALITDLLDLAKIEAGRMEVRSEPLSLSDLFEGLTSILKPLTEAKNLTIETTIAPDVPIIQTDPAKLQQILYNFLSNAIKFSPAQGTIELRAARHDDQRVGVSVTDHGPGIAPEQHSTIFEKFRQLDGSVTREHGGTGLGLAISRELAILLGGSVRVDSEVGKGATFRLILPLKVAAGPQDVRQKLVLT